MKHMSRDDEMDRKDHDQKNFQTLSDVNDLDYERRKISLREIKANLKTDDLVEVAAFLKKELKNEITRFQDGFQAIKQRSDAGKSDLVMEFLPLQTALIFITSVVPDKNYRDFLRDITMGITACCIKAVKEGDKNFYIESLGSYYQTSQDLFTWMMEGKSLNESVMLLTDSLVAH
jgi:hypothetical protein